MISQGFDINITNDFVDVYTGSSVGPKSKHIASAFFSLFLVALFIFRVVGAGFSSSSTSSTRSNGTVLSSLWGAGVALLILWIIIAAIFYAIRSFFPNGDAIHCTRSELTVRKIPTLNFSGEWKSASFPVKEVTRLHFGIVRFSRYNTATGLLFTVSGKKYKVFDTLQIPEAIQVMDGLQKLGVDVIRDVAEPMAVQMALEQRKSKLGKFLR